MGEALEEILQSYNSPTLTALTAFHKIKLPTNRKVELARALSAHLSDPTVIHETYAELPPAPREVVDWIQRSGGEVGLVTLRQRLLQRGLIDPPDTTYRWTTSQPTYRQPKSRRIEDVMAYLLACGLVFGRGFQDSYGNPVMLDFSPTAKYFIPENIRKNLPPPPPEPAWTPPPAPAPARLDESSARAFQRDLYLYWSYLNQNEVELTAKGLVAKRHLTAINATLLVRENIQTGQVESDFPRLVFIRGLLEQMGLAVSNVDLQARPAADFFALDPLERIKRTLEAYIACTPINELLWSNKVQASSGSAPILPAPPVLQDARRLVLLYLKAGSDWLDIEQIVNRIRDVHYEFLFSREIFPQNPYAYRGGNPYISYSNPLGWQFPEVASETGGWNQVEANLIRTVIRRPLFWMGLVDLGRTSSEADQAAVFRLTGPGGWLLASGPAPEITTEGGQVVVQPDFTIMAFDPISDAVLHELEQFAQRISAERAIQFRLTQASVYAGQQQGWDARRIQAALEGYTGLALPGNIARTLQEWQGLHERIRVRPGLTILHSDDPLALAALQNDPELAAWLQERPAEGMAIVSAAGETAAVPGSEKKFGKFYNLLLKKAWLPLVTTQPDQFSENAVALDEDGRLTFRVRSPDLYLRGFLARFAEADGPEGYRLTAASVRRAANSGIPATQIVTDLERVIHGSVPEGLRARLLAWAGHYGQAVHEEAHLLHLKDIKTMDELLKDPQLSQLLSEIRPLDLRSTVRVRAKDLERVLRLLEERGVEIKHKE